MTDEVWKKEKEGRKKGRKKEGRRKEEGRKKEGRKEERGKRKEEEKRDRTLMYNIDRRLEKMKNKMIM